MPHTRRGQPDQHLRVALALALALHAAVILGVSFDASSQAPYRPQIDVTLAYAPTDQEPVDASHFAQANQQGSGDRSERAEVSARTQPAPASPRPSQRAPARPLEEASGTRNEQPLTARDNSERQLPQTRRNGDAATPPTPGTRPEVAHLSRELAHLEATLDEQARAYSNLPRVRRLTSLSTRTSVDAAYLHDWRQRVEAVGNHYYPEASVRYGIYGSLRLLVVIDHSGRLEDIRILASSGYALLDEAAIKIVRMAAPYAPFPPELRATADKLEIIRTWQFQENRLSSG